MEWYYATFRVLSLVVTWAIPALLVLAVIAFAILSPLMALSGVGLKLYNSVITRLGIGLYRETHNVKRSCSVDGDCPTGYMCINGRCVPILR